MNTVTRKRNIIVTFLVTLLLLTTSIAAAPGRTFRQAGEEMPEYGVTGKTEEAAGAQPWTVALVEDGQNASDGQFCCGTLLAPQWVLTAAHCIEDTSADKVDVIVGRQQLSSDQGERIDATHLILHPKYNEFHDIGLIHLAHPATAGKPIETVTTLTESLDDAPTVAHVAGWGLIPERGEEFYPDKLHGVDVPIITQAQCKTAYGSDVDSSVICAGLPQGGADSCGGDSGGPLVVPAGDSWALAGVVSWGDGCGLPGKYGVYTRVESYDAWIKGYLNGTSALPEPDESSNNNIVEYPSGGWFDDYDNNDWADELADYGWSTAEADKLIHSEVTSAGFVEAYDLGRFDGSVESLAVEDVESEIVTAGDVEILLEDWSDNYGPYFIGLLNVDGRLIEIHSDISAEAVMDAVDEVTR